MIWTTKRKNLFLVIDYFADSHLVLLNIFLVPPEADADGNVRAFRKDELLQFLRVNSLDFN